MIFPANNHFAQLHHLCSVRITRISMRKLLCFIMLSSVLLSCTGRRNRSKLLPIAPDENVLSWSAVTESSVEETDTLPNFVKVTHRWRDLPSYVYLHRVPEPSEITRWEEEFETINAADSTWRVYVECRNGVDQYMAIEDFLQYWHYRDSGKENDEQIQWRLLQWDPYIADFPMEGFARIHAIRTQFETLMDYQYSCQDDTNMYGWLWTDFLAFYIRILHQEIESKVSRKVAKALRDEARMAILDHEAISASYQTVMGDPVWPGSSFPYRVAMFGKQCLDAEATANELFLYTLIEGEETPEGPTQVTRRDILREYDRFTDVLSVTAEEDEVDWKKMQLTNLRKERQAWIAWMNARDKVSALLKGKEKEAFEIATGSLYRDKLIQLKNRYNMKGVYCLESIEKNLAQSNWTDGAILSHNLEELLADE